jgi:hypothetical protein
MSRRLFLPVAESVERRPTVDVVRKRLGGRASTEEGAGEVVAFRDERGLVRTGVVVFVRGADRDVWVPSDVVRRVRHDDLVPTDGIVPEDVSAVAKDAIAFARLHEGQRVSIQHQGGLREGLLVEKCRFGALVELGDQTIVGVGFRRVWGA